MQVWILTFDRPAALNRLVKHFSEQGIKPNIFSNHSKILISRENLNNYNQVIANNLNTDESNSWCARSWNSILIKCLESGDDEFVLIQDDTDIGPNFVNWLNEQKQKYDFMWGPAGDQFHFIRKSVFQKVGWWDERYIGCYAGDAEYLKRVYIDWDRDRISVEDSHNWGFRHNACGISENVITTYQSKTVDTNYENQHWEFERILGCGQTTSETNPVIKHAQAHFQWKWGIELDNGRPLIENLTRAQREIDWYPWATKKYGVTTYENYFTSR
jgi:hypothetical protein